MVKFCGFIVMELIWVTLTVTLRVTCGWKISVAVITAIPSVIPVTPPALFTVATLVSDDCQVTWVHDVTISPSENTALTESGSVVPLATNGSRGVTMIADRVLCLFPQPLKPAAAYDSSDRTRTRETARC